jgi:hypothetical protein
LKFTNNIKAAENSLRKIDYIEQQYSKYGIEMKPCENIDSFLDKIKNLGGEMKTASSLLFNEISEDLEGTYQHIIDQQETLNGQFSVFKTQVYKI